MSDEHNNVILLPRRRTRPPIAGVRTLPLHRHPSQRVLPAEPTISDYELHAFVDDALDPVRRERVQIFLLRHPSVATDAAAYRHQNRLLREMRRERPSVSPAVGYLSAQFARRLVRARGGRVLAWGAAAVVLAAAVVSVLDGVDFVSMPHVIVTARR